MDNLSTKVNVAIRVRPLIEREIASGAGIHWSNDNYMIDEIDPVTKERKGIASSYAFDHIFDSTAKTDHVYKTVVAPLVNEAFKGFNGTVLCYGQTSSGKTHSLYGSENEEGIISLAAQDIFKKIRDDKSRQYIIRIGLVEIYNEKVTDLNSESRNEIEIVSYKGEVIPKDLKEIEVLTPSDLLNALQEVQSKRKIGATKMNEMSSRSHTLLRILIESVPSGIHEKAENENDAFDLLEQLEPNNQELRAVLNFVDLAGSESVAQTNATGERFTEAKHINSSLSTLALVVNQLSENMSFSSANMTLGATASLNGKIRPKFVNYRDSKLTRILQSSLSGNAFITLICNVTPASAFETHSTLRFARSAKKIETKPKPNLGKLDKNQYEKKITELMFMLQNKSSELTDLQKKLSIFQKFVSSSPEELEIAIERRKTCCPSQLKEMLIQRKNAVLSSSTSVGQMQDFQLQSQQFDALLPTRSQSQKRTSDSELFRSHSETLNFILDGMKRSVEEDDDDDEIDDDNKIEPERKRILIDQEMQTSKISTPANVTSPFKRPRKVDVNDGTPVTTLRHIRSYLGGAIEEEKRETSEFKELIQNELAILKEELKLTQEKVSGLTEENDKLKSENSTMISKFKDEKEKNEYEVDSLQKVILKKENIIKEMKSVGNSNDTTLSNKTDKVNVETEPLISMEKIDSLIKNEKTFNNELDVLKEDLLKLTEQNNCTDEAINALNKEKDELNKANSDLQKTLNEKISEGEKKSLEHDSQLQSMEQELDKLKSELEEKSNEILSFVKADVIEVETEPLISMERIDFLIKNEMTINNELVGLKEDLLKLTEQNNCNDEAINALNKEKDELNKTISDLQKTLNEKISELEKKGLEHVSQLQSMEQELDKLKSQLAEKSNEILSSVRAEVIDVETEPSISMERIDFLIKNEITINNELIVLREELLKLTEQSKCTEDEDVLNKERDELNKIISDLQETLINLQDKISEVEKKKLEHDSLLQSMEQDVDKLKSQLEEKNNEILSSAKAEVIDVETEPLISMERINFLIKNEMIINNELVVLREDLLKLTEQNNCTDEANNALNKEKDELNKTISDLQKTLREMISEGEKKSLEHDSQLQSMEQELDKLKSQLVEKSNEILSIVRAEVIDVETEPLISMEKIDFLIKNENTINNELVVLREELLKLTEQYNCADEANNALNKEKDELNKANIDLQKALKEMISEVEKKRLEHDSQLQSMEQELDKIKSQLEEKSTEILSSVKAVIEVETEPLISMERIDFLIKNEMTINNELIVLREELLKLTELNYRSDEANNALNKEKDELNKTNSDLQKTLKEKISEGEKKRLEHEQMNYQLQSMEQELDKLKSQLVEKSNEILSFVKPEVIDVETEPLISMDRIDFLIKNEMTINNELVVLREELLKLTEQNNCTDEANLVVNREKDELNKANSDLQIMLKEKISEGEKKKLEYNQLNSQFKSMEQELEKLKSQTISKMCNKGKNPVKVNRSTDPLISQDQMDANDRKYNIERAIFQRQIEDLRKQNTNNSSDYQNKIKDLDAQRETAEIEKNKVLNTLESLFKEKENAQENKVENSVQCDLLKELLEKSKKDGYVQLPYNIPNVTKLRNKIRSLENDNMLIEADRNKYKSQLDISMGKKESFEVPKMFQSREPPPKLDINEHLYNLRSRGGKATRSTPDLQKGRAECSTSSINESSSSNQAQLASVPSKVLSPKKQNQQLYEVPEPKPKPYDRTRSKVKSPVAETNPPTGGLDFADEILLMTQIEQKKRGK